MKLSSFPRPKGDNGRGIHWSPSTVHPEGSALDPWIDELQRMNIKWVKVLDDGDGSSLELCRRLVQVDMMPIVRMYRLQPNPGRLSRRQEETIRRLVDIGVVYFETNNEPDSPSEWKDERLPPDWAQIVVAQFIHDADRVLALGGLPGLPALSVGNQTNLISLIVREGRADLFARGAWIAVHNYTLNHPLQYPDDEVNQAGAPLTRLEYERHGAWAWDNQSRQLINIWRRQGKRPGHTIEEDSDCWRSFELANLMAREALGYSVPVIGTEGGAVIGWRDDRRYPRVTPELHKEWTVGINHYMQTEAPDYFFTTCHWLLANFRLGHHVMGWESQAWFTDWWEAAFGIKDHLPTVDAVREMPSIARRIAVPESEVRGVATDPAGREVYNVPITLLADGQPIAETRTNARGRFRFIDLPAGDYELDAEGWIERRVSVHVPAGKIESVKLTLEHGHQSVIRGKTVAPDGSPLAGVEVSLRKGDEQWTTTSDATGKFAFLRLSAGRYELRAGGGRISGIELDGWQGWDGVIIVPPPPTPRFVVATRRLLDREENAGRHLFFGYVWDEHGEPLNGIAVEMGWKEAVPGIQFPIAITGQDPRKPAGYYEFVNTPGQFYLRVAEAGVESEVAEALDTADVPGRRGEPISYEVNFQRQWQVAESASSTIEAAMPGCPESTEVVLQREGDEDAIQPAARREGGRFIFEHLPAGRYACRVADLGIIGTVEVDGFNPGSLHFPMQSAIVVEISPRAGLGRLRLTSTNWGFTREVPGEPGQTIRFDGLPAGEYQLRYLGWHAEPLHLDGRQTVTIRGVESHLPHAASLEGRVLSAEGDALAGRRVMLLAGSELRGEQLTDRSGRYRFAGLNKGVYTLRVEEAGILHADILLDERESKVIDLVAPMGVRPKLLEHYLLLAQHPAPGLWVTYLLLQEFIRQFGPVVGFDPREAALARRVTIVADESVIGPDVEKRLLEAGCVVQRLPSESYALAEALRRTGEQGERA